MYSSEKEMLFKKIQQMQFVCVDLNLYLNTHPQDARALTQYNLYAQQLAMAKQQYEMKYGPLMGFGWSPSKDKWKWIYEPWPWETDYNREVN